MIAGEPFQIRKPLYPGTMRMGPGKLPMPMAPTLPEISSPANPTEFRRWLLSPQGFPLQPKDRPSLFSGPGIKMGTQRTSFIMKICGQVCIINDHRCFTQRGDIFFQKARQRIGEISLMQLNRCLTVCCLVQSGDTTTKHGQPVGLIPPDKG